MSSNAKQKRYLAMVGVVLGFVSTAFAARAGWPGGGLPRTIPGVLCTPFSIPVDASTSYCPFISDYVSSGDSFEGIYNGWIYVDFHVSSTNGNGWTTMSTCRQPYTGGAAYCAIPASEQDGNTGVEHLGGAGFANLNGVTAWDYFYVEVTTTEIIDQIYGVGYGG